MPAKVVCPSCHIALDAPDDLLGQTVKCEECGSTFTARAPARPRRDPAEPEAGPKARYRRRDDDDDDEDDRRRPRKASRFADDDEDGRPRRRAKRGSNALPFILAGSGLVFFVLLAAGVGLYFLLSGSSKRSDPTDRSEMAPQPFAPLPDKAPPVNPAPAAGARKVTLSNPRWTGPFSDFQVDYQIHGGGRLIGMYKLKIRFPDGSTGESNLHTGPFEVATGTWTIRGGVGPMGRARRAGAEIWVEEGGVGLIPGTKVSNSVTLN